MSSANNEAMISARRIAFSQFHPESEKAKKENPTNPVNPVEKKNVEMSGASRS